MKKKIYILLAVVIIILIAVFLSFSNNSIIKGPKVDKVQDKGLKIITTNNLLYGMVLSIVKDVNQVEFMFKTEQEQWNFNFSKDSLNNVAKKDIFIYSGGGFEPWVGNFIDALNKERVTVLNVSRGSRIISRDVSAKFVNNFNEEEIKDNAYYWMDVDKYRTAIFNICKVIEDKDPENKAYYEKNFEEHMTEINNQDNKLKNNAKNLKNYTFVVQGDSLDYFTNYLGFKVIKIPESFDYEKDSEAMFNKINKDSKELDKIVFLYTEEDSLKQNEIFIKSFKMKVCNIEIYEYSKTYEDMLKENICNLGKIYASDE